VITPAQQHYRNGPAHATAMKCAAASQAGPDRYEKADAPLVDGAIGFLGSGHGCLWGSPDLLLSTYYFEQVF